MTCSVLSFRLVISIDGFPVKTTYHLKTVQTELAERQAERGGISRGESRALRSVLHMRDLMWELLDRDLKVTYKRSILGVAWTLVTPLLQLMTYSFLFCIVLGVKENHYSASVFAGLLTWNWFSTTLVKASICITSNGFYLLNPKFPIAILPPSVVTTGLIHLLFAIPALLIVCGFSGVSPGPVALLAPLVMAVQFGFTLSLAYPLAALNVSYRDTQHILTILLNMGFVLTPVFYSIDLVPDYVRPVYQLNPMNQIIEAYRAILIRGCQPDWGALTYVVLVTAILLPLGYRFFRHQATKFVEEI